MKNFKTSRVVKDKWPLPQFGLLQLYSTLPARATCPSRRISRSWWKEIQMMIPDPWKRTHRNDLCAIVKTVHKFQVVYSAKQKIQFQCTSGSKYDANKPWSCARKNPWNHQMAPWATWKISNLASNSSRMLTGMPTIKLLDDSHSGSNERVEEANPEIMATN